MLMEHVWTQKFLIASGGIKPGTSTPKANTLTTALPSYHTFNLPLYDLIDVCGGGRGKGKVRPVLYGGFSINYSTGVGRRSLMMNMMAQSEVIRSHQ